MTLGKKPLTKKAGEFYARCNLTQPHVVSDLPHYLRREYEEKGWKMVYRPKLRRGKPMQVFLEPLCDGFETTDRTAFEDHMKTVHGKKPTSTPYPNQSTIPLQRRARGKWRTPKAQPEGTPIKPSTKAIADDLHTCETCGLVMEHDGTLSSERFVREHLERCVGDRAAAS